MRTAEAFPPFPAAPAWAASSVGGEVETFAAQGGRPAFTVMIGRLHERLLADLQLCDADWAAGTPITARVVVDRLDDAGQPAGPVEITLEVADGAGAGVCHLKIMPSAARQLAAALLNAADLVAANTQESPDAN